MGRSFHRFSDFLEFFFTPFSRINFLGYPPLVLLSCCFSERVWDFLCGFCCIHRPDLAFLSFFASLGGLHVEHFKDRKASRLRGRYARFVYCFSCRFGQAVRVQGAWLATPSLLHAGSRLLRLALNASSLQDMLVGGGSNIYASGMLV